MFLFYNAFVKNSGEFSVKVQDHDQLLFLSFD